MTGVLSGGMLGILCFFAVLFACMTAANSDVDLGFRHITSAVAGLLAIAAASAAVTLFAKVSIHEGTNPSAPDSSS